MAGGKTAHQKFLGVVAGWIATKVRVTGARNGRLACSDDRVIPAIGSVGFCSLTIVARPFDAHFVSVMLHGILLHFLLCRLVRWRRVFARPGIGNCLTFLDFI